MSRRIEARFAALRAEGRAGLVAFLMAGDPDGATSARLIAGLPAAGADLIEIGMPFSDPMADGPAIQAAGQRALKSGMTLQGTLDIVRRFRTADATTPVVLMGYYNPVYRRGGERFVAEAAAAGVDGLIIVDLPPEEADELLPFAETAGLAVIRLTAPTTDEARLPAVLARSSGFVYHVAIAGITGTKSAATASIAEALARLRRHTRLPVAVGFGIKTPEQAAEVARLADAAVVGSALVQRIAGNLDAAGRPLPDLEGAVLAEVRALAAGIRAARRTERAAP
ncbi:MAG TPA: tryptophan synthase subunit alpha [Stellaceae bacterium]|nr:tryptophan synthase subunit alpha [Stellaceae bacterium]